MSQVRIKERFKYTFQYLVFDLTISETITREGIRQPPHFEVEVEISNLNHLYQNLANPAAFARIVRRYLQNVAALTHIVHWVSLEKQQQQAKKKDTAT